MKKLIVTLCLLFFATSANAEFIISSAIVDFTKDSSKQQDIELISRGKDSDYIVTQIYEVQNPGSANEYLPKVV